MLSGRTPFASTGDDTPEAILARIESGKVNKYKTNTNAFYPDTQLNDNPVLGFENQNSHTLDKHLNSQYSQIINRNFFDIIYLYKYLFMVWVFVLVNLPTVPWRGTGCYRLFLVVVGNIHLITIVTHCSENIHQPAVEQHNRLNSDHSPT